ncbi:hypothetical protein NEDG_01919 [Nematocida displodere]|uniref:RING-type domain-containing protein n=1 Tax=Nematocida displodere TaxID=1805483 RepID=A0A177EGQ0_9MICR|nr:hypothetical protein NEDG_01919 [Nematocida displodere]
MVEKARDPTPRYALFTSWILVARGLFMGLALALLTQEALAQPPASITTSMSETILFLNYCDSTPTLDEIGNIDKTKPIPPIYVDLRKPWTHPLPLALEKNLKYTLIEFCGQDPNSSGYNPQKERKLLKRLIQMFAHFRTTSLIFKHIKFTRPVVTYMGLRPYQANTSGLVQTRDIILDSLSPDASAWIFKICRFDQLNANLLVIQHSSIQSLDFLSHLKLLSLNRLVLYSLPNLKSLICPFLGPIILIERLEIKNIPKNIEVSLSVVELFALRVHDVLNIPFWLALLLTTQHTWPIAAKVVAFTEIEHDPMFNDYISMRNSLSSPSNFHPSQLLEFRLCTAERMDRAFLKLLFNWTACVFVSARKIKLFYTPQYFDHELNFMSPGTYKEPLFFYLKDFPNISSLSINSLRIRLYIPNKEERIDNGASISIVRIPRNLFASCLLARVTDLFLDTPTLTAPQAAALKDISAGNDDLTCPICLGALGGQGVTRTTREFIRILMCGHYFCSYCIKKCTGPSLPSTPKTTPCPMCRRVFNHEMEYVVSVGPGGEPTLKKDPCLLEIIDKVFVISLSQIGLIHVVDA